MPSLKLRRLWQPRSLRFWLFVAFNLLSAACSWALRALPLGGFGLGLLTMLALLNAAMGMWMAWLLLRQAPD